MGQRQVTAGFPPRPPGVPGHSWLPAQGPQEPRLPFTLARGCHPWQQAEGGQGLQGGSCGTQGRKRPWGGMGATLAWPRGRGMSPRGWDGQGSYHDTQALMGRTQTWGRLDVSGACLAQKSSIFIQACSGGGKATVWPPSPGVATHPRPLQRDGVPAGTLTAQV